MELVITLTPIVGVLVAICALIYQISRSRFSLNVELCLKLEDKFNSPDFRKTRSNAAKLILKKQFVKAEDVFDYFETLGYLVREKALDKKIVWSTFFEWVQGYWSAGIQYIQEARQEGKDQTIWEDFEYLHNELLKIQRERGNSSQPELLSHTELVTFLKKEFL
jgi:hypothetical protein